MEFVHQTHTDTNSKAGANVLHTMQQWFPLLNEQMDAILRKPDIITELQEMCPFRCGFPSNVPAASSWPAPRVL